MVLPGSRTSLSHMRGTGSSDLCVCVCVCVCVPVTTPVSTMNALRARVRYQQKALDTRNKTNVGIELKLLGSKVKPVINLC